MVQALARADDQASKAWSVSKAKPVLVRTRHLPSFVGRAKFWAASKSRVRRDAADFLMSICLDIVIAHYRVALPCMLRSAP